MASWFDPRTCLALVLAAVAVAPAAGAWTRPGHMVTAEIAWSTLAREQPEVLGALAVLLDAHPDKGPFEVAIDRTTGAERTRRMFYECARWPDDIRGTDHDRPLWHAALRPLTAPDLKADLAPLDAVSGAAIEALNLNFQVLASPRASNAERALALCWVMHIAGDLHQPLHSAELFSATYPSGDGGGARQYVIDPIEGKPVSLHWLWDDCVHRSGVPASVEARAADIMAEHPRTGPVSKPGVSSPDFSAWAFEESYPLAQSAVHPPALKTSRYPLDAPDLPDGYWTAAQNVSEARVASAGYRLADLLAQALIAAPPSLTEPR